MKITVLGGTKGNGFGRVAVEIYHDNYSSQYYNYSREKKYARERELQPETDGTNLREKRSKRGN